MFLSIVCLFDIARCGQSVTTVVRKTCTYGSVGNARVTKQSILLLGECSTVVIRETTYSEPP